MKYFSGFSLKGEEELLEEYLFQGDTCVAGFSYGAQRAFEYAYNSKERIDRLFLLSPAFFQTQKSSFIRAQLQYFETRKEEYLKEFLNNLAHPSNLNIFEYLKVGTQEELQLLLTYRWDIDKIKEVINRGTTVEVFIGGLDRIIDSKTTFDFFAPVTTTYFMKDKGHLLNQESVSSNL